MDSSGFQFLDLVERTSDGVARDGDFVASDLTDRGSRQIPLGPVDERQLPAEVKELSGWAREAYPLNQLGDARTACLAWLKQEYWQ